MALTLHLGELRNQASPDLIRREAMASQQVCDISCDPEDLSLPSKKRMKKSHPTKINVVRKYNDIMDSTLVDHSPTNNEYLIQVMDIQKPVSTLRTLLENRLGVDLSSCQIWLQDKFKMQLHKSLGDQCIQSEGLAKVKVELQQLQGKNRINIVDVLRCQEEDYDDADLDLESVEEENCSMDLSMSSKSNQKDDDRSDASSGSSSVDSSPSRWTINPDISSIFPVPMPADPTNWVQDQIHHWLRWAMQEFHVNFVDDSMWSLTGKQLCRMTFDEFHKKVPIDPQNMLWTHIELLRNCHVFAVTDKAIQHSNGNGNLTIAKVPSNSVRKSKIPSSNGITPGKRTSMTGHNGQIQLWQFLLELLGDRNRKNVIQWVGNNGEFKLNDPELVAQMWGDRKNKPKMNYEKLSRALRYYYSESMIAKVHGRRFVYKFVCNLKELVGYTAEELILLVDEDVSSNSQD